MSSKLQNNQLPQDSEALREKFKDDVEQSQQAEQQFKEELLKDETFEKLNQELQEDGYELTDAVFNTESNDTGNFTLDYQNSQGEWANLQGSMNDGQLDELKKQTQASQEAMNENLRSSEAFQELDQQLLDEGFVETGTEFDSENLIPSEDSTGGGSESANQNLRHFNILQVTLNKVTHLTTLMQVLLENSGALNLTTLMQDQATLVGSDNSSSDFI